MAIRLAVDYVDLQVSVKTQEIVNTVSFADDSAPSLTTEFLSYSLGVDRQIIAPISGILLDFTSLDLDLDYQNINVEVLVDSDTKNLYFRPGNPNAIIISVGEEAQILVDKIFNDSLSMGDEDAVIGVGLSKAEASLISYNKVASPDSISFADNQSIGTSSLKADSLSLSELSSYLFDKNNAGTLSMLEANYKVFGKAFVDSFPMASTSKSDEITMVEAKAIILGSTKSDTVSLSESNVISLSQIKADSFAISESINILIILGGTSVFNTAAFNTSALN